MPFALLAPHAGNHVARDFMAITHSEQTANSESNIIFTVTGDLEKTGICLHDSRRFDGFWNHALRPHSHGQYSANAQNGGTGKDVEDSDL